MQRSLFLFFILLVPGARASEDVQSPFNSHAYPVFFEQVGRLYVLVDFDEEVFHREGGLGSPKAFSAWVGDELKRERLQKHEVLSFDTLTGGGTQFLRLKGPAGELEIYSPRNKGIGYIAKGRDPTQPYALLNGAEVEFHRESNLFQDLEAKPSRFAELFSAKIQARFARDQNFRPRVKKRRFYRCERWLEKWRRRNSA